MRKGTQNLTLLFLLPTLLALCARAAIGQGAGATAAPTPAATAKPVTKISSHPRMKRTSAGRPRPKRNPLEPVSLWVISKPPNCKVFADGQLQGETNAEGDYELKLSPGPHAIRVARDGYVTSEGEVDVVATPEAREVEFTLAQAVTALNVMTTPGEAEVYLDDSYRGTSNNNSLLVIERVNPSQPHTLRVSKVGYQTQTVAVTTYIGQISVALVSNSAKLTVKTIPPEAEVYLDDVYRGTSTGDGLLVIEGVNPNQTHTLRSKKDGYQRQSVTVGPKTAESTINLAPDPVVLLIKSLKQNIAAGRLVEAFAEYSQLSADAPDHQEMTRLLESLLQNLQARSTDILTRVGPYGLSLESKDLQEMNGLYKEALRWRVGDDAIDGFGKYWALKNALVQGTKSASMSESNRRIARTNLLELGEHNLRNAYLLFDMGWAWERLNDRLDALKYFDRTQESKPDWAYPHFARGFLAMNDAESEAKKTAKVAKYGLAIESFSKAISLKHDFARSYELRSISYGVIKRYEESIASGLQAVAIDPQSAYAHFALGFAYFQKGKSGYRNALPEFNQALMLDGGELDEATKSSIQQRLALIKKSVK
jgi:tetratricopeptide (TPR) repeat protein